MSKLPFTHFFASATAVAFVVATTTACGTHESGGEGGSGSGGSSGQGPGPGSMQSSGPGQGPGPGSMQSSGPGQGPGSMQSSGPGQGPTTSSMQSSGPGQGPTTVVSSTAASSCGDICCTGLSTSDAQCDSCLSSACCNAANACLNDPNCSQCFTSPQPSFCTTNGLYNAWSDCYVNQCGPACGFYPICSSEWGSSVQACATCEGTYCCSQFTNCDPSGNCGLCITGMGGTNCGGDAQANAVNTCIANNCSTQCM